MKKQTIAIWLCAALLLTLPGCQNAPTPDQGTGPGRMIRRIEVAIQPEDERYARNYETQENMNALLELLRSMQTDDHPDQDPDIHSGQSLYTATVTFANGQQSVYYLLGHSYLRLGDDPWCLVDPEQSRNFTQYLLDHPSDHMIE